MYNILFKFYLQFSVWYLKLWACYLVQLSLLLSKRKLLSIRTRIPLGILHLKGSSKALYYRSQTLKAFKQQLFSFEG